VVVSVAALIAACCFTTRAAPTENFGWRTLSDPFRVAFIAGRSVITAEAPTRLQYMLANGSVQHATTVIRSTSVANGVMETLATTERGRRMALTVTGSGSGVHVRLRMLPTNDVVQVLDTLTARRGEHFLGGGRQGDVVDLRQWLVNLKVWNGCGSNAPAPLFVSSAGYGLALDTPSVGAVALPGVVLGSTFSCQWGTTPCKVASAVPVTQLCMKGAELSYDVMRGTPRSIVEAYTRKVGRSMLPAAAQFALMKWRDAVSGGSELLADIHQLRARGLPVGWVVLDNPWERGGCNGSLSFDPAKFPHPASTIAAVHRRGVRLMLWVSPNVTLGTSCARSWPKGSLVTDGSGTAEIDLTNASARALFVKRVAALIGLGVDGIKGDRGDEIDLEQQQLAGGSGLTYQNAYPVLFARAVADAFRLAGRPESATLFRAAYTGSAGVAPGFWVADQTGDLHGLRNAIRGLATIGLGGPPVVGSDIGGYRSQDLTADILVRWAQLGAVSPVFEIGGQGPNATFWKFGSGTVSLVRAAAELHYELFPLLYDLARNAHRTGVPILRPLAFEFPRDAGSWSSDLELMVGPYLLAAPVVAEGSGTVEYPVYLPPGRWVDLFDGVVRSGGRTFSRPTPLDELPLFLRAGRAIRFDLRSPELWRSPWRVDELGHPGRAGWLYAPAPQSTAAGGRFRDTKGVITVGRMPAKQSQAVVLLTTRPHAVRIDGRKLGSSSASALRLAAHGWSWREPPFGGVLLKLAPGDVATIVR
jgi:alpha-D-xyloside xylohydrolase